MITYNTLKERKAEKERFEQEFGDQLKDTTISLEERWALFCAAIDQGLFHKLNPYYYRSKILNSKISFSWYLDMSFERYEVITYKEAIIRFEDQLEEALDPVFSRTIEDCVIQSAEELDALKEEFLATGYGGFKYDW